MAKNSLLVFGIGPVQGFIASARRTQDLWMGSYILAYLVHKAIKAIGEDNLVYPTVKDHPLFSNRPDDRAIGVATLPNKFTAEFATQTEAEEKADKAEKAVAEAWSEIAEAVKDPFFSELIPDSDKPGWHDIWSEQAKPKNWIETYWVAVPGHDGIDYKTHSNRAEQAFAMRKNLRDFQDVVEKGEKDSISGIRAALGKAENQQRKDLREDWMQIAKNLRQKAVIDKHQDFRGLGAAITAEGSERLSSNGVIKRFSQRFFFEDVYGEKFRGRFPSTSSVASAVFREQLLDLLGSDLDKFADQLESAQIPQTLARDSFWALRGKTHRLNKYDGAFLYPATFTKDRLEKDYTVDRSDSEAEQDRKVLIELRKAAAAQGITLPSTYYSLILFDGDKMGDKFSQATSKETHQQISDRLQDLALKKFLKIVEDDGLGRMVYAGGDDLMAFVPLERVVQAVGQIQKAFATAMEGAMENTKFTISGGVVIAHHMAPLDLVLKAARAAEKRAKSETNYNREAVVFSLLKRSGERVDVGAKWDFNDPNLVTLSLIQDVIKAFQDGLSASFAHHFMREAPGLAELAGTGAVKSRLHHLLKRHGGKETAEKLAAPLAQLAHALQKLFDQTKTNGTLEKSDHGRSGTLELARWFMLARFIAAAPADD